ncbi:hypothetical protein ANRL4_00534 [Anaerolineae bacterium]|nr:hypothetical protein ANRL4_00534 [Anaerolineae bacterium]
MLDPQEVYGSDFPGETFRVLKQKMIKAYRRYGTRLITRLDVKWYIQDIRCQMWSVSALWALGKTDSSKSFQFNFSDHLFKRRERLRAHQQLTVEQKRRRATDAHCVGLLCVCLHSRQGFVVF